MTSSDLTTPSAYAVERVRHAIRARMLTVRDISKVTPQLVRVTFHSPDLEGFVSASFDDHIKLFFPADGIPILPTPSEQGLAFPEGAQRPPTRDYTPRSYRATQNELDIEFVLHGDGPAANWVSRAKVGDQLVIAGPRGSFVIPDTFNWLWLIGDETALPAIARRLEELPSGASATVVALVQNASEQQSFSTKANAQIHWVHRDEQNAATGDPLEAAVRQLDIPASGEGYIWAAGEAAQMRAIHQYLTKEKGIAKTRIRASSYWKKGAAAVHETLGADS